MMMYDTNGNWEIGLEEFEAVLKDQCQGNQECIDFAYGEFKKADHDGSGSVSGDELAGAIYASMEGGPPPPKKDETYNQAAQMADAFMKTFDTNGDQKIDTTEFGNLVNQNCGDNSECHTYTWEQFKMLDANGDGAVEWFELHDALMKQAQ